MVIPKNEYCNSKIWLYPTLLVLVALASITLADDTAVIEKLNDSYHQNQLVDPNKAETIIADLKTGLTTCPDTYLTARGYYRIGILYFKAGQSPKAVEHFNNLADKSECPLLIRASSLNMLGQIYRMEGVRQRAADTFEQLCILLEKDCSVEQLLDNESMWFKLWHSARQSRAEIFWVQQDYQQSTKEYQRIIKLLTTNSNPQAKKLVPLAYDRTAQIAFLMGDIDKYFEFSDRIIREYPQYQRIGLIKFEVTCVRFCRGNSLPMNFGKGICYVPVQIIGNISKVSGSVKVESVLQTLEGLIGEYKDSYWNTLLQYHYAWLLDGMGEKDKAGKVFARIYADDKESTKDAGQENDIIETAKEYAKIQYAIILGEKAEYARAKKVLATLKSHSQQSHLGKLAQDVGKSIKVLKREVRNNYKKK